MSELAMNAPRKLKGKHVLFALLGFFGTVIAVNAVFVYVALDTWTGLTTPKSYVEGLNYNSTIRDAEMQRERGWNAEVSVSRTDGRPGLFEVTVTADLRDRDGRILAAESVAFGFRHPMNETFDRTVKLTRDAAGHYAGTTELPVAGNWDTRLTARMPDGTAFRQDGSIWIN